ncbi:hypothetical protein C7399_11288 [Paraburkholderia tropica]|uniref:Uncharacterized protein n=2 Tax=Paraburkholderia tropica TaxID=92647 RepID=A0ABX5MPY3_9BURK|nr:hypothetical protein C7400_11288 [Paraburkholderia tropica]PZW79544.1 hypothetical protein C7399_11288 [Paraburkholderia tropica]
MPMRAPPALLAVAATLTAACLSIMAGWQRGGFLAERVLWIAVGVVLVVAAHLLPALVRAHGWRVRAVGALLWIGCIAATCYGHAVFFLMAQKHAGELRAAAVPAVTAKGRGMAEIARDRADAVTRLARTNARRCFAPCPNLIADRTAAAARVEEFDTELAAARRAEAAQDRVAAERAAALNDPVTGALTAFGVTAPRAELVTGLAFAGVLEAVACFAWLLALRPVVVTVAVTESPVTPAQQGSNAVTVVPVTQPSNSVAPVAPAAPTPEPVTQPAAALMVTLPVIEQADEVTRVTAAVAAGTIRATVTEIRKFLGCSQSRAAAVRKQIESQVAPGAAS